MSRMKSSWIKKFIAFSMALVFIAGPALRTWASETTGAETPVETPASEGTTQEQQSSSESSNSSSSYDKAAAQAAVNEARQRQRNFQIS